jgi:hypothetical protein
MSAQVQSAHDHKLAKLLVRHGQAMSSGDYRQALAINQQLVSLNGSEGDFPALDAAAIFAPLEPVKYIIQALDMCPGAPAMWAGYGYSGKTLTAQSAALGIAAGLGRVWDCFAAPQGRALHIDYEQGSRLTRERYQRLAYPHMIGPDDLGDRLSLVTMPTRYLDDPAAELDLERLVRGYTLVIVDSLRAACPTLDENSSEIRRPLDMMARVSERTGAAFLIIHHARKPQKDQAGGAKMAIRGSGALFDACGSVCVFEAEKDEPVRVSHEKARASGILTDDFELAIEDVADDAEPRAGLVVRASAALSREDAAEESAKAHRLARAERLRGDLKELFRGEPEQGGADTIARRIGRKASDVRGELRCMADDGLLETTGSGSAKRYRWLGRD